MLLRVLGCLRFLGGAPPPPPATTAGPTAGLSLLYGPRVAEVGVSEERGTP